MLANLMFTLLESLDSRAEAHQVANVAHAAIRAAAEAAKAQALWAADDKVKQLKLSNKWITGFLRCAAPAQRDDRAEGAAAGGRSARARMAAIQQVIREGGYAPGDFISVNEMGIVVGAQPMHQHLPRGRVGDVRVRHHGRASRRWCGMRRTAALAPRARPRGRDLRSARILDTLMRCPGFTVGDGWEQKT